MQYQGGDPFTFAPDKYDDWLKTTGNNPIPVEKTVESIADLVRRVDAAKGANLDTAINKYYAEKRTQEDTLEATLKKLDPKDKPAWCSGYPVV